MGLSRLQESFAYRRERGELAFVTYVTGGYDDGESCTVQLLLAMQRGGADVIEIGIPFSDPVADGPTIQIAGAVSLAKGITLDSCLRMVSAARSKNLTKPVLFMTYFNPLMRYGLRRVCEASASAGVDGFIVVDLPIESMVGPAFWGDSRGHTSGSASLSDLCREFDLSLVPLIAPTTTVSRMRRLIDFSSSFVYVNLMGVTGTKDLTTYESNLGAALKILTDISNYQNRKIEDKATKSDGRDDGTGEKLCGGSHVPVVLGFGVSSGEHVRLLSGPKMKGLIDGFVVGSAIVNQITSVEEAEGITVGKNERNAMTAVDVLKAKCDKVENICSSIGQCRQICRDNKSEESSNGTALTKPDGFENGSEGALGSTKLWQFGHYGGRYIPETLMAAHEQLDEHFKIAMKDPEFLNLLGQYRHQFINGPTPIHFAKRLSRHCEGAQIWFKREELAHTGSHKLNNALGQCLLAKRMGKTRIIAETGAGQHGVATATACAVLGLSCVVYMGAVDAQRQHLNVFRIQMLGGKVVPVTSGSRTLKDAVNEALKDWVSSVTTTHYVIGSAIGPHPFPDMVREFQACIGREARAQMLCEGEFKNCGGPGRLPDVVVACVGGGSNAIGMFSGFLKDENVALVGVEGGGKSGPTTHGTGCHAAPLSAGFSQAVFHCLIVWHLLEGSGTLVIFYCQVPPAFCTATILT
eukprot:GHVQ01024196.1.p1 GENE.GHVQ01024196.1~~GHVQ01024196.1.p1  ORF type:complete len:694 (+),score=65.44 GHVQ01024196.1:224-2305(+)